MWKGTKSGLLWPALLYMIGLVDENDQPKFFEDEVESRKLEDEVEAQGTEIAKDEAEEKAKDEAKDVKEDDLTKLLFFDL